MKKKVFSDIFFNILLQFSIIATGLILPRFIIGHFGSTVNGMVVSINQFLSYITLLESGIGGVIKSQLYKPLFNKDSKGISGIVNASNGFFKKLGIIFIIYLLFIAARFKDISSSDYDWFYIFFLVLILGISTLVQYFVGLTYQTVIQADQHYTFTSLIQIVTLWLSVGASILIIYFNGSIHLVKLVAGLLFAFRPICYYFYAKSKYKLDSKTTPDTKALSQRWDGFGHHIAYFIHSNTDIVLLTIFVSLNEVSVYSVYLMVISGIRSIISAISSAFEPYFGRLIASGKKEQLETFFGVYELFHFFITTVLFAATLVLIIPFVRIYTAGINDYNYIRTVFSIVIVLAELLYSFRTPYSMVIFASGHFKQTKTGAFIEAGINIILSLILIKPLGIVGVAIGTFVAMFFRTTEYAFYLSKNIVNRPVKYYFVKTVISFFSMLGIYFLFQLIKFQPSDYLQWTLMGLLVVIVSLVVVFTVFLIGDFKNSLKLFTILKEMLLNLKKEKNLR